MGIHKKTCVRCNGRGEFLVHFPGNWILGEDPEEHMATCGPCKGTGVIEREVGPFIRCMCSKPFKSAIDLAEHRKTCAG
jgi:DnaJ-class molecular chaperone